MKKNKVDVNREELSCECPMFHKDTKECLVVSGECKSVSDGLCGAFRKAFDIGYCVSLNTVYKMLKDSQGDIKSEEQ